MEKEAIAKGRKLDPKGRLRMAEPSVEPQIASSDVGPDHPMEEKIRKAIGAPASLDQRDVVGELRQFVLLTCRDP